MTIASTVVEIEVYTCSHTLWSSENQSMIDCYVLPVSLSRQIIIVWKRIKHEMGWVCQFKFRLNRYKIGGMSFHIIYNVCIMYSDRFVSWDHVEHSVPWSGHLAM